MTPDEGPRTRLLSTRARKRQRDWTWPLTTALPRLSGLQMTHHRVRKIHNRDCKVRTVFNYNTTNYRSARGFRESDGGEETVVTRVGNDNRARSAAAIPCITVSTQFLRTPHQPHTHTCESPLDSSDFQGRSANPHQARAGCDPLRCKRP